MRKFKNYSLNDKVFYVVITALLTIFFVLVLYPCVYVISASFSSGTAVQSGMVEMPGSDRVRAQEIAAMSALNALQRYLLELRAQQG